MKKVLILGKIPKSDDDIVRYKTLVSMCDDYGFEVLSSPDRTGTEIAFTEYGDIFNDIADCDLVIADVTEETIQQGMQLKEADTLGKPIIVLINLTSELPTVIEGLPTIAEVLSYDNIEDVREGLLRNFSIIQ